MGVAGAQAPGFLKAPRRQQVRHAPKRLEAVAEQRPLRELFQREAPDHVAAGEGRVRHQRGDQIRHSFEHHRADGQKIDQERHADDQRQHRHDAANARDDVGEEQDDGQEIGRRFRVREIEKNSGGAGDGDADEPVPGAIDEQPDENQKHHAGAGAVLVGEEAAPVAGELRLGNIGRLVNRQMRQERNAEITGKEDDDRGDRQQPGKMLPAVGQEQQQRRLEDGEAGEHEAPAGDIGIGRQHGGDREHGERHDQRQRHGARHHDGALEDRESRERTGQQHRARLAEQVAGVLGIEQMRIAQIRERRDCEPRQKHGRQEQEIAQRPIAVDGAGGRLSLGRCDTGHHVRSCSRLTASPSVVLHRNASPRG